MIEELEKPKEHSSEDEQGEEEESMTLPVEEIEDEGIPEAPEAAEGEKPKNPLPNADSMLRMLKVMKPIIANIPDPEAKESV